MNRRLATAANEFEADIIIARLAEAGVHAWALASGSLRRGGGGGPHDVFVEEADLETARQALQSAESVSEAELTALSEQSPPPPD